MIKLEDLSRGINILFYLRPTNWQMLPKLFQAAEKYSGPSMISSW
jgi:hypothetical protein